MDELVAEEGVAAPGLRRRAVSFAAAIVLGLLLAWVAPADWPDGAGTVALTYHDLIAVEGSVAVGATAAVSMTGSADGTAFEVVFPDGLPTDAPVRVLITARRDGATVEPDLGDIEVTVVLSDGRSELIPVVSWNDADQQLEAMRRPSHGSAVVLGLLGMVVVLWVSEALPLFVTSLLIPVVLVVAGIAGAAEATAPFANPIIVLFFAGFLMAEAMRRAGLDHYVAVWITARAGRSAATLLAAMLGVTAFLSMWMSNTAATAVLVPIAIAVTAPLADVGLKRALVLGIAYAATIGGIGSAIGTPANQLAIEFLDEFGGRSISFVEWFAFGLPMVVLFLPVMGVYLWRRSRITVSPASFAEARRIAVAEAGRLGGPNRGQLVVLAVFAAVAAGWLTETMHGVHAGIVALAGAVALFVLGKLLPEDLGRISWAALLTFGGGLTLGLFLVATGTSDYVATRLVGLADVPGSVAVLAIAVLTLLLTTVASNTASAAILIPLAIPLAAVLGIDPTVMVVVVAIASSIDFALVIGTPPTMIAYSTGLFTAGRIFRVGAVLDLIGILILAFGVTWVWDLLGVI